MKKILMLILILTGISVFAHFPIYVNTKAEHGFFSAEWTPVQFGILPCENWQIFHDTTNTVFAFGLIATQQKSAILSAAPINALTSNYFIQAAILCSATTRNYGFSFGLLNGSGRNYGIQTGLFNLESNFGSRSEEKRKECPDCKSGCSMPEADCKSG